MSGNKKADEITLKVLVVGPCESGKTRIANFLASTEKPDAGYQPTIGVRSAS